MPELVSYINGTYLPAEDAALPLNDLGLLRGYGVFDFLRTYHGVPFRLRAHVERLATSAQMIDLDLIWTCAEIEAIVGETLRRNQLRDAGIKIVVTGGPSTDGIMPDGQPTLIVVVTPLGERQVGASEQGVRVVTVHVERPLSNAKTLNYISAIMALERAKRVGAVEALYVNRDDHVLEGTRTNFFAVRDGVLITPCTGMLLGITRQVVLELAEDELETELRPIVYSELATVEEAFLTSTTKEISPIVQIDDMVIGTGKPGSTTGRLQALFRQHINDGC